MEIKIIEDKKDKLIVDIESIGHTFCNVLKNELWNDKHVKVTGYTIDHPLVAVPRIVVETDGEDPRKVLVNAVSRLKKVNEKFRTEFEKAV